MTHSPELVLAITGGSGAIYSVRLLEMLLTAGCHVHLLISQAGHAVLKHELDIDVNPRRPNIPALLATRDSVPGPWRPCSESPLDGDQALKQVTAYDHQDFMAPVASGSHRTAGMVVCPASGATISAIAHGSSGNLIHRAADVHLKERRKLVLVPRETPLSTIQLDNLKRCADAGAVVLPAMPGFYHGAKSIADLVDFIVTRICDQLGVDSGLMQRWGEQA